MSNSTPNHIHFQESLNGVPKLLILVTMLFVAVTLTGCLATGNFAVSPTNVNFGNVAIGSRSAQSVTITNSSDATFAITRAAVSGRGFELKTASLPLMLGVGQSATFTASFSPLAVGDTSGTLLITKTQISSLQAPSADVAAKKSLTTQQAAIAMTGAGVPVMPLITTQPTSQTITAGQTATFSVVASGQGHLTYQWWKNGVSINGATSSSYNTPAATASDTGSQFTVVVSNSKGSATSDAAALTVTTAGVPPSITLQPASQTLAAGQPATFQVAASGIAPLSYQWLKNGAAISGATSSVYTTPITTSADSGSKFAVSVSNSIGSVTSSTATLTVKVAAGQLTTSTTNLSYGNITVGSSSMLPVTLTNTGGSSVSISNVTLSGAGLSIGGVSSGMILIAGNSAVLNVTYAPSASGTLSGSVSIASNATNPTVTIALSGTAVQPVSHSVELNLTPSSTSVTGYNVYRSSTSNGPYTKLNSPLVTSTTYTDTAVVSSQTYFYVGTSVDSAGNETAYSNQVSATIPTP